MASSLKAIAKGLKEMGYKAKKNKKKKTVKGTLKSVKARNKALDELMDS